MDIKASQETLEKPTDRDVLNELRQNYVKFRDENKEFERELTAMESMQAEEGGYLSKVEDVSYTNGTRHETLRPPHYGGENNTYEAIKVIEAWSLGFSLGNVVKYISRAGKKQRGTELEDLEKAATYLGFRIDELKRKSTDN